MEVKIVNVVANVKVPFKVNLAKIPNGKPMNGSPNAVTLDLDWCDAIIFNTGRCVIQNAKCEAIVKVAADNLYEILRKAKVVEKRPAPKGVNPPPKKKAKGE